MTRTTRVGNSSAVAGAIANRPATTSSIGEKQAIGPHDFPPNDCRRRNSNSRAWKITATPLASSAGTIRRPSVSLRVNLRATSRSRNARRSDVRNATAAIPGKGGNRPPGALPPRAWHRPNQRRSERKAKAGGSTLPFRLRIDVTAVLLGEVVEVVGDDNGLRKLLAPVRVRCVARLVSTYCGVKCLAAWMYPSGEFLRRELDPLELRQTIAVRILDLALQGDHAGVGDACIAEPTSDRVGVFRVEANQGERPGDA